MGLKKKYREFKYGVINDIEASEVPHEAMIKSDGFYFRENFWRKLPGLTELNTTAIGAHPVWGIIHFHRLIPQDSFVIAASGSNIYKYDEGTRLFSSIHAGMVPNQQVEFLADVNFLYFGSQKDNWRRFDGGSQTYPVGNGATAPKKFSKIIYNPYAQKYFGIGDTDQPDGLYDSEHIDDGGIEQWVNGPNIIESVEGDYPLNMDIFEGRITLISKNSINSGNVIGVRENWSFQKDKAIAGTIAGRTFKRYKDFFLYLTPDFDLCKWPSNELVNKGRVKFNIDPNFAHLACAEVIENRYYVLVFKSGEAVSSNKYHLWVYDILGDAFYGPHTQYNLVSLFYDRENRRLLCGGTDDLSGFVLDFSGRNIKNTAKKMHLVSSYSDYGFPFIEKRYNKGWIKTKQSGDTVFDFIKDSSLRNHEVIVAPPAEISTDQKVFGRSSLRIPGTGFAYCADSDDWHLASGDFSMGLRVRFSVAIGSNCFLAHQLAGDRGWEFQMTSATNVRFHYSTDGTTQIFLDFAWTPSLDTWYELLLVRYGDILRLFVDGTQQDTDKVISGSLFNSTQTLRIGQRIIATASTLNGFIDELFISKGIARQTANYTIATEPREPDSYDVLLLHFDDLGSGPLEVFVNTNNDYGNPQSQKVLLEDPANQNLSDINAVKEAITKRFDIYEQYGLGNAIQYELRHELLNGDVAFSELTLDYDPKEYEKENAS